MTDELHVWTADKEEWVVAATALDARDVYCAHLGSPPDESSEPGGADFGTHAADWSELPDDQVLKIRNECDETHALDDEDADEPKKTVPCPRGCDDEFIIHHAKTCAEWVSDTGRGYLCSANI